MTPKGPDKDNLLSLQSDIRELINLTKESLENLEEVKNSKNENSRFSNERNEDPLDREYALFKVFNYLILYYNIVVTKIVFLYFLII